MKRNLNYYYMLKRKSIIASMVMTGVVSGWRTIYYFLSRYIQRQDLKYNFLARQPLSPWQIPLNIGIMLFDVFIPILLMVYYIKAIDFQKYLMMLMKACELNEFYPNSSYFICINSKDKPNEGNLKRYNSKSPFKDQDGLEQSKTSDASSVDPMRRQLLHETRSDFNQDSLTNGDGYKKVIQYLIIGFSTT